VSELIIKGKGRNDLVEMNCGLTKSLDGFPDVQVPNYQNNY
jgi:hypothetical protein